MASLFLIVISGLNVLINKTGDEAQPCLVPQTIWNQGRLRWQPWTGGAADRTDSTELSRDSRELWRQDAQE